MRGGEDLGVAYFHTLLLKKEEKEKKKSYLKSYREGCIPHLEKSYYFICVSDNSRYDCTSFLFFWPLDLTKLVLY